MGGVTFTPAYQNFDCSALSVLHQKLLRNAIAAQSNAQVSHLTGRLILLYWPEENYLLPQGGRQQ